MRLSITPRLVQLNKNKSLLKAFAVAAIVLVVFALASPSPAPTEQTSPSPAPTVSEAKPTPKDTAADNSTPDSLLKQEGFGVVKLKQGPRQSKGAQQRPETSHR
jgi:hypothetical protein